MSFWCVQCSWLKVLCSCCYAVGLPDERYQFHLPSVFGICMIELFAPLLLLCFTPRYAHYFFPDLHSPGTFCSIQTFPTAQLLVLEK